MKIIIKIFAISLVLFTFSSCKKYPNGPSISLRSRAERVANNWKMEKVTINGTDFTSAYTGINYSETYDKSGNYSYSSSTGSGSGKWEFQNSDKEIKRSGVKSQSTVTMIILRLKEKSFWYSFTDSGDNYEFHLIPM